MKYTEIRCSYSEEQLSESVLTMVSNTKSTDQVLLSFDNKKNSIALEYENRSKQFM